MASVEKMLPKMRESMMPAGMASPGKSAQGGDGLHGQAAGAIARPEVDLAGAGARRAADAERLRVERGTHRAELEARDLGLGPVLVQQLEQQRRKERSVHDEAGIA